MKDPTMEPNGTQETLLLSVTELRALTGYRQPAAQLAELHRQGFFRARRLITGGVLLERAHYQAVCAAQHQASRPRIKPPVLRSA